MNRTIQIIFILFLSINSISSRAQSLQIASISDASAIEGGVIVHTVTMSGTSTTDQMYTFNDNFIFNTVDAGDWSEIHIQDIFFTSATSNIFIMPAGQSTFRISTFTTQDTIEEEDEFYTVIVNGVSAIGTIIDDDSNTTTISGVTNAEENEGDDLVHVVTLSNYLSATKTFPLSIVDVTTDGSFDYDGFSFSDGITYDSSTGLITIPSLEFPIDRFTISVPTIDDLLIEDDETYRLYVGSLAATGTIIDNDTVTISSVSVASETEGDDLVHTIRLSNINPTVKYYSYSLIDNTTSTADYNPPIFSNGVTLNVITNILTVPIGIERFTITVPTIDDPLDENDEFYDLLIEDFSVTGTIIDNDIYIFPKYFTPNNDSIHDTWPTDLVENNYIYDNSIIYIFDRFGKILKEVSSSSIGWDGTYNGKELPENDYWFKIILQDGKVHRGHFTLKR